jgi:nucleotide-binding universal stress UspA family protein
MTTNAVSDVEEPVGGPEGPGAVPAIAPDADGRAQRPGADGAEGAESGDTASFDFSGAQAPEKTTVTDSRTRFSAVPETLGGRIVVGVDDSEQAATALRWALAEGSLRQATVEVVHTWSPPVSALPFGATLVVPIDESAIDAAARSHVEQIVAAAVAATPGPGPAVQVTILPGTPSQALVEVAEGADLLVVGSHGRTGFSRMVLGSVAMAVVHHAPCPVVVVRTPPD